VRLHDRKSGMPYGVALAAAALWLYPSTAWFTAAAG
jgi:prepilin peptidase CpaA